MNSSLFLQAAASTATPGSFISSIIPFILIVAIFVGITIASVAIGRWAERKGYKFIGFFLISFFISPIIAVIIVACISDKNKETEETEWISKRILELIQEGKDASAAKIQAEAEYNVEKEL